MKSIDLKLSTYLEDGDFEYVKSLASILKPHGFYFVVTHNPDNEDLRSVNIIIRGDFTA